MGEGSHEKARILRHLEVAARLMSEAKLSAMDFEGGARALDHEVRRKKI